MSRQFPYFQIPKHNIIFSSEKFGYFNFSPYLCIRKSPNKGFSSLKNWKVGRVIDRAGLEIRYTPFGYRGFESLTFRCF